MSAETARADWGPLAEPIHPPVPEGMPPWKDNSYLAFWDTKGRGFGVWHFSTSPNAEGRRSRMSFQGAGHFVEIIEEPAPGTFDTASISFELGTDYRVGADNLHGTIHATPHHALADYNTGLLPPLVEGEPLQHFQRAARVTGTLTIEGEPVEIDGYGLRDRTWGYRDESVSFVEYSGGMAVFEDHSLACMSFMGADGTVKTDGFILTDTEAVPVHRMTVTRDASGLYAGGTFDRDGGPPITVRTAARHAGMWVPMGWERTGPTMSAYDEFITLRAEDGSEGIALIEQGQIRNIF